MVATVVIVDSDVALYTDPFSGTEAEDTVLDDRNGIACCCDTNPCVSGCGGPTGNTSYGGCCSTEFGVVAGQGCPDPPPVQGFCIAGLPQKIRCCKIVGPSDNLTSLIVQHNKTNYPFPNSCISVFHSDLPNLETRAVETSACVCVWGTARRGDVVASASVCVEMHNQWEGRVGGPPCDKLLLIAGSDNSFMDVTTTLVIIDGGAIVDATASDVCHATGGGGQSRLCRVEQAGGTVLLDILSGFQTGRLPGGFTYDMNLINDSASLVELMNKAGKTQDIEWLFTPGITLSTVQTKGVCPP